MKTLKGRVAVVAGATRGAGRGIACMLGEAGATVYCTGRSVRGHLHTEGAYAGRPETIEETAGMVTARGGKGIYVRVDHLDDEQVKALFERVSKEQGRLDVLVNDISEGVMHDWQPFWKLSVEKGFKALRQGIHSHIITNRHAVPLMIKGKRGLIVEIGDGDFLSYRGNLFYDLVKMNVNRLAYAMAQELHSKGIAAIAVTPGYMRTEMVLDHRGVTEENWRDAVKKDKNFITSETPFFVGRAVAALAADPNVLEKSGGLYGSWTLSDEYGFTDIDGKRPHWGNYFKKILKGQSPLGASKIAFEWMLTEKAKGTRKRSEARG